jgi:hypothetical protein
MKMEALCSSEVLAARKTIIYRSWIPFVSHMAVNITSEYGAYGFSMSQFVSHICPLTLLFTTIAIFLNSAVWARLHPPPPKWLKSRSIHKFWKSFPRLSETIKKDPEYMFLCHLL